ncbi:putative peptidoglycan-binding domain-containing protein [Sulfitobacter noctilucicola]|uniref:Uncharacterized protein n=1 Tax=Sulfitobacter noctilucicola TaxID=1342301 RepID=A0A7W6Q2C2_9RHOB|nr:hypothetical protein [Sulfitobacter noctilucicola]KIN62545.1 putative peptidoglycan-binding domain-containing protein [Sulfitobacter noctilucicola]MBB4172925.1 hypothetical protein [Sulfitobacter noctilucicola]
MSGLPKIHQIRVAEAAIDELTAKEEVLRKEFMEDGLDKEEKERLDSIKTNINMLKAKVTKLRKELERNKARWENKAKQWAQYKVRAGKLLDSEHPGAEKAVRLEVDIAEAEAMEHWADATMLLATAEKETAADWKHYELHFPPSQIYGPLAGDFNKRRNAADAAENLTDAQARTILRLAEREYDAKKAAEAFDYVKAYDLIAAITEELRVVETELGMAPAANLSGRNWFQSNQAKYPNSKKIGDLEGSFKTDVTAFKKALEDAGVKVKIGSTLRDTKRAALMHYAWTVGYKEIKPSDVPTISGVDINYDHGADELSVGKALEMVRCFNIVHRPSLKSNHTRGTAIDWTLSWSGDLTIKNKAGEDVEITSSPKSGQNTDLHTVGDGYGVKKLKKDPPHWSHDGN